MKHYLLISMLLLAACSGRTSSDYRSNLEILCKGDDYKVLGKMSNGLLTDSLFYFRQNSLIFKQYWENGNLLVTEYNDNGHYRELKHVSRVLSTNPTMVKIYHTDKQDTSFLVNPYDTEITNFYRKVRKHNAVKFKVNETTIVKFLNVPQGIISVAVVGGIVKRESDGFSITPTKYIGDTISVGCYYLLKESSPEWEVFIIE